MSHHHLRTVYSCGHVTTCRCMAPKETVHDDQECPDCRQGGGQTLTVGKRTFARQRVRASLNLVQPDSLPPSALIGHDNPVSHAVAAIESDDLTWVSFILDTEGGNLNWDHMPRDVLVKSYASIMYKPMDIDHVIEERASMVYGDRKNPPVNNTIHGVITHAALADAKGNLLTDEQIQNLDLTDDPNRAAEDKICVVAWAALWSYLFPKTVNDVLVEIGQGNMHVSMERWIPKWDFMVGDSGGYKAVARAAAEQNGTFNSWQRRQSIKGRPVLRRSLSAIYGGAASTMRPANPACTYLIPGEPDITKAAASSELPVDAMQPMYRETLFTFLRQHRELHEAYTVSTSEQDARSVIAEHRRVTQVIASLVNAGETDMAKSEGEPDNLLDLTLPPDLQHVVGFMVDDDRAPNTETTMTTDANASKPITIEDVRAEAKRLMDTENSTQAVANRMVELSEAAKQAEVASAKANKDLTTANDELAKAKAEVTRLNDELKATQGKATKAEASVEDLTKQLDAKNQALANLEVEKAIAGRKSQVAALNLPEKFTASLNRKAEARDDSGHLRFNDEDFKVEVTEVAEAVAAIKPADTEQGKGGSGTDTQAPDGNQVPGEPDLDAATEKQRAAASLNGNAQGDRVNQWTAIGIDK